MMTKLAVVVAGVLVPLAPAMAQDDEIEIEVDEFELEDDEDDGAFDRPEVTNAIAIGAGTLGAVDQGFRPAGPDSVAWNLRYGWSPVNMLSWEFGYIGATDAVSEQGPDAVLATLFETDLKVDVLPGSPVTPFLAGGVGVAMYTMGGVQDLGTMTVPLTAGIEGLLEDNNLLLGSRFTYRPAFFDRQVFSEAGADNWTWTADIGTVF